MTIIFAVLALIFCYVLIWHTKLGYAMRTMGHNSVASRYAGISNARLIMIVMAISGALAGMTAVNEVLGQQGKLVLDITAGYGFVGIAVALMGRNHPVGIALAAILFGALYQGGLELQFAMPAITRDMIVVIQALVILFTGAMEGLLRPGLETAFMVYGPKQREEAAARETVDDGRLRSGMSYDLIVSMLAATLRLTTPLLLACLAGLFSERSGIFDIGLEGKMLAAAFGAAAVAVVTGNMWLGLLRRHRGVHRHGHAARHRLDHAARQPDHLRRRHQLPGAGPDRGAGAGLVPPGRPHPAAARWRPLPLDHLALCRPDPARARSSARSTRG